MPLTITQLNELRAKRAAAITNARSLLDKAEAEKRDLNADEQKSWDGYHTEAEQLTKQIAREERQAAADRSVSTPAGEPNRSTPELDDPEVDPSQRAAARSVLERRGSKQYREAFNKFLTRGLMALTPSEHRDLSSDSDADGGYLVAPQQMVSELLKNLDDMVYIRSKARKFTLVQAKSLGVIKRTAKMSTWAWGGEITEPTKDSSLKFGTRALSPNYMSGLALVSRDLLRNSTMPAEQLVREEMAINAAELQEAAFMTGHGVGQPLGVFTASNDGISTARDVKTGSATAILADGLFDAKYSLKEQYRRTAEWMFSRAAIKQIAKLKDGEGRYLWEPSLRAGEPDRILALPYVESEFVPATFTDGLYVGLLANWSHYWIADALDMEVQRLIEKYALSNQDGFVGRMKLDAAPQLEEAFARVKLGV